MTRAIIYARQSNEDHAKDTYSLEGQVEEVREFLSEKGWTVEMVVEDPGGKRWTLDREGLDRVRRRVKVGDIDYVVAWKWDRFGEAPWPEVLAHEFEEHETKMISLDDLGEGEDADLLRGIKSQIAKKERRRILERTMMGKNRKIVSGKIIAGGRRPVYGYRYNDDRSNYVIDDDEMMIVKRILEMASLGDSLFKIRKSLDSDDTPTPNGGKNWSNTVIKGIIEGDAYMPHTPEELIVSGVPVDLAKALPHDSEHGLWYYRRRKVKRTKERDTRPGKSGYKTLSVTSERDREEWIAVPIPERGLDREAPHYVPAETILRARQSAKSRQYTRPEAGGYDYELSGRSMLRCSGCGRVMGRRSRAKYVPKTEGYKSKVDSNIPYHYYYCSTTEERGRGSCERERMIRAEPLEEAVWTLVREFIENPERVERAMEDRRKQLALEVDPKRETGYWIDKLEKVKAEKRAFQRQQAEGLMTFEELREEVGRLKSEESEARGRLEILGRRSRARQMEGVERERILADQRAFVGEKIASADTTLRKEIYARLNVNVSVRADDAFEIKLAPPGLEGFYVAEGTCPG